MGKPKPASARRWPGAHALTRPSHLALVDAQSGRGISYAELHATANRLAHYFAVRLELEPGDHIAACLDNTIETPQIVWGAHYAGLRYTLLSTRLTADEIVYILRDSTAKVFIAGPAITPATRSRVEAELPLVTILGVAGSFIEPDLFESASTMSCDDVDGATEGSPMLYSSGTTGRPKGVKQALSNRPIGTSHPLATLATRMLGATAESVYLSPAPLYHAAPLLWTRDLLALGATVVVMERFDASETLGAIERYQVTHGQFVPTMFSRMLALEQQVRARYRLDSLVAVVHAAAPCPESVKRAMIDWWGPIVHGVLLGNGRQRFVLGHPATMASASGNRGPSCEWSSAHRR